MSVIAFPSEDSIQTSYARLPNDFFDRLPNQRAAISPKKLAANRANAKKSTGPRSPAGKTRSSQNRLKHALYSTTKNPYPNLIPLRPNTSASQSPSPREHSPQSLASSRFARTHPLALQTTPFPHQPAPDILNHITSSRA